MPVAQSHFIPILPPQCHLRRSQRITNKNGRIRLFWSTFFLTPFFLVQPFSSHFVPRHLSHVVYIYMSFSVPPFPSRFLSEFFPSRLFSVSTFFKPRLRVPTTCRHFFKPCLRVPTTYIYTCFHVIFSCPTFFYFSYQA